MNYIGNPLAYDASLSGIGKGHRHPDSDGAQQSRGALAGGGIAVVAFVSSCDFYPSLTRPRSEPTASATRPKCSTISLTPATKNGFSVAEWEAQLRATVSHESKHVVSYTDRIINNSPSCPKTTWLEEGIANEVSSEIWMRHFNQATWIGHATFAQTAACEINISTLPDSRAMRAAPNR